MTTCDSRCSKTHAKPTQAHMSGREQVQPSQQNPSERVSNASTLASRSTFTKSVFALYLLYLDSSLSSRHISIHIYPSTLCPLRPYLLCLDFWSPDPLIPDPDLVNTYSSVVSLSYCTSVAATSAPAATKAKCQAESSWSCTSQLGAISSTI